jgi:methionine synthase II (cobalamin-independent)
MLNKIVIKVCNLFLKYQMDFFSEIKKINDKKEINLGIKKTARINKHIEYMKTCNSLFNNNDNNLQKCMDKIFN